MRQTASMANVSFSFFLLEPVPSSQRDEVLGSLQKPADHEPCDRQAEVTATIVSQFSPPGGQSQAWSDAWHGWDGKFANNDAAACPPAAKRTKMSKRQVFRCLKIRRASGSINGESAMIHCDTISNAAANWNANRWACACGRDNTQVITEHGEDLVGTQWAGERSYGNLTPCESTLWVRVKRHAIHHRIVWFLYRRCVEVYYKSSSFTHDADGREHSTCCRRNLYHNILLVFGLVILWHPEMSLTSVSLNVVYWSVLHLILDSTWVWYSLLLELKIPALVWHWDCFLCRRHWELRSLFSPCDDGAVIKTLGEEFELAGNLWWRESTTFLSFGATRCIGIVRTMAIFEHLICLKICVMRCFGIVRTIPTSSSSCSLVRCLLPTRATSLFYSDFDHRLQGQHYLYATLLYIVDWRVQWSKDYSDTTVFGWPTLWMSNRTFYSTLTFEAVRCSLYVESWFGDGTLCSDYI